MEPKRETRLVRDIAESLGKLPPAAIEIEEAILGAVMMFSDDLNDVAGILRPEHFYLETNKEIYHAIQDIYSHGDPVSMLTVVQQLRKNGKLELIGGASYVVDLVDKNSQKGSAEYNVRILQEHFLKRQFILMASTIHQKAYDDTSDVFELIDWTNKSIQDALDQNVTGQAERHIKEFAFKALKDMEGRMSGHLTGVRSGYESVDRILNGHQNGDFVVLGARPGMGKTAYLFQEATEIAKTVGPVGMFSLEMPGLQLLVRAACSEAEIDNDRAMKGQLDEYEFRLYMDQLGKLSALPIYIDDGAALNILEVRARARRMKLKYGVVIIFIDYLQLIKAVSEQKGLNRDQEIGIITRTIKAIAKELEIPVVVISSLSRDVEKRGGTKRPQLADVRESGCLLGSTLIYCPHLKKRIRIEDLIYRKKIDVLAFNGKINKTMKAANCFKSGHKEVFELQLITGQRIQATKNHKFLTQDGWVALEHLNQSALIAVPIDFAKEGKSPVISNEARILGHFLANGSCVKSQPIRYTCNNLDQDLADAVMWDAKIATKNRIKPRKEITNTATKHSTTVYFKPTFHLTHGVTSPMADLMRKYNLFNVRSKIKFIPDEVFFWPRQTIYQFLKALFSGDGTVTYSEKYKRKALLLAYSSASDVLITGVQQLLLSLGIVSTITRLTNKTNKKNQSWGNLAIQGKSNIERFVKNIGFCSKRKNSIMVNGWEKSKNNLARWTKTKFNEERSLVFVPVKSVTPIGKHDVYDIEVPNAHCFTANGILVHNSIESDADVVMFLYRPEYYGITEDEHGRDTHGLCEVIIAKHRNGALGTALLKFIGKHTRFKPWIEEVRIPDYSGVKNPGTPERAPEREIQLPLDPNLDTPF